MRNIGYSIKDINRIVLTHVHIDHIQAVNEIKKLSGGHAKIYSHWAEAGYLANNPYYQGPPTHEAISQILQTYGIIQRRNNLSLTPQSSKSGIHNGYTSKN